MMPAPTRRGPRQRGRSRRAAERHGLPQPEPVGRRQPAAGAARPRARRARGRHRAVLRVAHRRLAVPELHARARSRATCPAATAPAISPRSTSRCRLAGLVWRTDPAAFEDFPEFFLAHEIAHQWWGQAVGWRNYHEQWLSEGFAQYFAALYAQHQRGDEAFDAVLRQLRRWGIDAIGSGADLSRLPARAHPQRQPRLPRARLQQGRGRAAHAAAAGRRRGVLPRPAALLRDGAVPQGGHRGFPRARWKRRPAARSSDSSSAGSTARRCPKLKVSHRVEPAPTVVACTSSRLGEIFDLPVTVTLQYADRRSVDIVVPVTDARSNTACRSTGVAARHRRQQATTARMAEVVKNVTGADQGIRCRCDRCIGALGSRIRTLHPAP